MLLVIKRIISQKIESVLESLKKQINKIKIKTTHKMLLTIFKIIPILDDSPRFQ